VTGRELHRPETTMDSLINTAAVRGRKTISEIAGAPAMSTAAAFDSARNHAQRLLRMALCAITLRLRR
jgi:hypothetical protein